MEKPRKSYSLNEIGDFMSSLTGSNPEVDKKFEKLVEKEKSGKRGKEEPLKELTSEEKAKYKYFSTYDDGKKGVSNMSEEYIPSDEYKEHRKTKIKNIWRNLGKNSEKTLKGIYLNANEHSPIYTMPEDKKTNILTNTEKPEQATTYTSGVSNNDMDDGIIKPSNMPNEKPKTIASDKDSKPKRKMSLDKIGEEISFEEIKNKPEGGSEQTPGNETRVDQDLKLCDRLFEQYTECEKELTKKYGNKKIDEKNARKLEEFKQSPYLYMKMETVKKIRSLTVDLAITKDEAKQQEIKNKIKIEEVRLNEINRAFDKNLPLKLINRKYNAKEITLDNGKRLNVDKYKKEINQITKLDGANYEIVGLVQRQNGDFLVLKKEDGKEIELDLNTLNEIPKEDAITQKEEKFESIKEGMVVKVRIGGIGEPLTSYKITKIKNGKVFFENLTLKQKGVMSSENMKKFLFGPKTEFIVEEYKESKLSTKKGAPVIEKNNSKRMEEISALEKEMGFEINSPLVIKRYLKVTDKEAQTLLDEYTKLRKAEPASMATEEATKPEETRTVDVNDAEKIETEKFEQLYNDWVTRRQEILDLKSKRETLAQELEKRKIEKQNNTEDKMKTETQKPEPAKENKKDIEGLTALQFKKEIEKVVKKFAETLKKKNIAYEDLDITGTGTGFRIVANLTGTGFKGIAIGNPSFIAEIKSVNGKINVPYHKLEANSIVKAFVEQEDIDNFANTLGDKITKYLESDRKKEVERIDIENNILNITYKK